MYVRASRRSMASTMPVTRSHWQSPAPAKKRAGSMSIGAGIGARPITLIRGAVITGTTSPGPVKPSSSISCPASRSGIGELPTRT